MIIPELAAAIAKSLRDFGYSDVTAEMVVNELALPKSDQSIIGMMATNVLEQNGFAPDGSALKTES